MFQVFLVLGHLTGVHGAVLLSTGFSIVFLGALRGVLTLAVGFWRGFHRLASEPENLRNIIPVEAMQNSAGHWAMVDWASDLGCGLAAGHG